MSKNSAWPIRLAWAAFFASWGAWPLAEAQVQIRIFEEEGELIEEFMVDIGSRARSQIPLDDLPVPVDLYTDIDIQSAGEADLAAALTKLSPSFNYSRNSIGDGGLLHPATLRGLSPDQTLVLVNGKRRHSMAWLRVLDGVIGWGTGGTDLRSVPAAAIRRVEVLRDGAAAQYGSDAIAGVINLVLKDNADGGSLALYGGTAGGAGGDRFGANFNGGFPLGEGGFINLTGEWHDEDPLLRNGGNGGNDPNFQDELIVDSSPEHDNLSLFLNAELPVGDAAALYAFGGWSRREGSASGAYRFRHNYWQGIKSGVAGLDGILPTHINFHERNTHPVHPNGFLPYEESTIEDISAALGLRNSLGGWDIDLSAVYGRNEFGFGVSNSINASIGAQYLLENPGASLADILANAGPTSGDSGGILFDQLTFNLDARRELNLGPLTALAAGVEQRMENYRQKAGDDASWSCGLPHVQDYGAFAVGPDGAPLAGTVAACGFQGYPGYSPENARLSDGDRNSQAGYVDLEFRMEALTLNAALRMEHYSDAGTQTTGKLAAQLPVGGGLALRGAFSTGFRAPSLSQRLFNSIVFVGSEQGLTTTLVANEGNSVSRAFGVDALEHETSENFSAGIVYSPPDAPGSFRLAIDAYRTDIDDRVVRSVGIGCGDLAACQSANVATAAFFFNGVNTRSKGLDLSAQFGFPLAGGYLQLSGNANFNKTRIAGEGNVPERAPAGMTFANYFGGWAEELLQKGQPRRQANFAADWVRGAFGATLRLNHYGKTVQHPLDTGRVIIGADSTVDLETRAELGSLRATLGVSNLFDALPTALAKTHLSNVLWGIRYPNDTPFGLAGRFVYLRLGYAFSL